MSYFPQQPPTAAREAFDEAMHKLSEALKAHQEAQNALTVADAHLRRLEASQQSPTGG